MVNAFEYYDEKNRDRIQNVKEMLGNQKVDLNSVINLVEDIQTDVQKKVKELGLHVKTKESNNIIRHSLFRPPHSVNIYNEN